MATIAAGIAAHLLVLAVWALAALVLHGLGSWLRERWGATSTSWRDVSLAFWLGVGVAIAVLQVWHLVRPVDGWAIALLVSLGVWGSWRTRARWWRVAQRVDVRLAGIVGVVLLWIANRALGPTALFDTGMYHQPSVWWANTYPVITGLGNLHGRLAFNSTSLLFSAAFDVGPLDGAAVHLVNSLFAAALVTEAAFAWHAAKRLSQPRAFDLFTLAILPNVLHGVVRQDVRSLSTDAAVCALLLVAIRLLFDAVAHRQAEPAGRQHQWAALLFLLTTAVTVKLSAAVVAAAGVGVATWVLWPMAGAGTRITVRRVAWYAGPPILLFSVWVWRGVLLSGYPLYPVDLLPFPVDWRVPAEQVAGESAWITMSARNLNTNVIFAGSSWVLPWLRGVVVRGDPFVQLTLPLVLTVAFGAASRAARRRAGAGPLWSPTWSRATWPLGAGLVVWLASAPHTRMAQGLLWSAAAIVLAYWASMARPRPARPPVQRVLRVALVVTIAVLAKQAGGAWLRAQPGERIAALADSLLSLPRDGVWMTPLPAPALAAVEWNESAPLWAPVDDNRCWNAPVLCTPHPAPALRLRGSGPLEQSAIRYGFRTEGGQWAPSHWPNPWTPFLSWWRCTRVEAGGYGDRERECLASVERAVSPSAPRQR